MLLRLVDEPFDDPDYIFELKHDGFPDVTYICAGECKLIGEGEDLFERKRRLALRAKIRRC
jgi:bifunctional non-homologous end joining protein LigD